MARLRRLGLQRRIMLLVTAGLAMIFSVGGLLGLTAIDEATQQVFEERLATAQATVAVFQRDVDRLASEMALLADTGAAAPASWTGVTQRTFERVGEDGRYPFFTVVGVTATDAAGRFVAGAGEAPALAHPVASSEEVADRSYAITPATAAPEDGVPFFDVTVPVAVLGGAGDVRLVAHTISRNEASPFDPSRVGSLGGPYNLEILDADGTTLLAVGSSGRPGDTSHHLGAIAPVLEARQTAALVDDQGDDHHVMAAVPVPDSHLVLVLEQPTDVALALPNRLRTQLVILIVVGFTAALLVAWFTTRRVTKPTAELTAAATRMARGDLSQPIDVAAFDEVATLAATLELMRQRLLDAQTQLVEVNRDLERRIDERTARLELVLRKTISAQEDERHALARELHDETAQTLAALSMALDRVRHDTLEGSEQGLERIAEAKAITARLLDEIRRLIMGLRPSILDDMGLGPAIAWYAETVMAERERPTQVHVQVPDERLPSHLEVALFRITQEALNNVAKHAEASNASVHIGRDTDVELVIEDDGRGFDEAAASANEPGSGGVGLAGMHERVALLGGTMTITSEPGQGTLLRVQVPVTDPGAGS